MDLGDFIEWLNDTQNTSDAINEATVVDLYSQFVVWWREEHA